jgi:hypothetical protein
MARSVTTKAPAPFAKMPVVRSRTAAAQSAAYAAAVGSVKAHPRRHLIDALYAEDKFADWIARNHRQAFLFSACYEISDQQCDARKLLSGGADFNRPPAPAHAGHGRRLRRQPRSCTTISSQRR